MTRLLSLNGHVGQEMGFDPRFETKFYRIQTQDCDQTVPTEVVGRTIYRTKMVIEGAVAKVPSKKELNSRKRALKCFTF